MDRNSVVANFATTAAAAKTYQIGENDHHGAERGRAKKRLANIVGMNYFYSINVCTTDSAKSRGVLTGVVYGNR